PSKDPRCAGKVADIVGLYLDPAGGAVVLSIDEKTQIQALDRTQPLLPLDFGVAEQRTHDYKRHGTTNLFAALDVATGQVTADCQPARDSARFLAFLRKAVNPIPARKSMWCWTTCPPTPPPRSAPGWQPTPTSRFTSPRPAAAG